MEGKFFEFNNGKIEYNTLYNSYLDKHLSPFSTLYYSNLYKEIHTLYSFDNEYCFYFSKEEYILNINSKQKNISQRIVSSYEIDKILQNNNLDIDKVFYDNEKYQTTINYFFMNNKTKTINLYYDNEVYIEYKSKIGFLFKNINDEFSPQELDSNFSLYFKDDINKKIKYFSSEIRENLNFFLFKFFLHKNIFKFTGPTGIGKSFYLLIFSRLKYNCVYLNLKAIKLLIKSHNFIKLKNLIVEECQRIIINDEIIIKNFNEMIKNLDMKINEIIFNLLKFFNDQNISCIFILDQFKEKEFTDFNSIENLIESSKNLKVIICSSINDKNIRESCINYFIKIFKNREYNINLKEYYIYFFK